MANGTTAPASVHNPMTADSAANAIEAMLSGDGDQQDSEAQLDEINEVDESEQLDDDESADDDAADDESDDEESDEDEDEGQDPVGQKFTVKIDGKDTEVSLEDLTNGYSRTADYTRKTQALAQERKEAQAEFDIVRQERQQYAQLLGALQQQLAQADASPIDMNALYESDPIEWVRQKELGRERQERQYAIQSEQQRLAQTQQAEQQQHMRGYLENQKAALIEALPTLRDPEMASTQKKKWVDAGKSIGFSDQELNGITDHRMLLALNTIAEYRGIVSKRQQIKPVPSATKSVRPGTTGNSQKNSGVKKSQQRLRSTGSIKDAASLIEKFL